MLFQNMFEIFNPEESYAILRYVFKWNTTKETLNSFTPASSFAKKVMEKVNDGKMFYESTGVVEADNLGGGLL